MSEQQDAGEGASPRVKRLGPPQNVPVYNCLVAVAPRNSEGLVRARALQVDGIVVFAKTEPEALKGVVTAFKKLVSQAVTTSEELPWRKDAIPMEPGEQQRFIAVHL